VPIVNTGKLALLGSELPYLATCYWGLFTSNTVIGDATVLASLTEAAWTGYARQLVGPLNTPTLVSNVATSTPAANPSFSNTSGVTQSFYGWFLVDPTGLILLAAVNLGATSLPTGATFPLAPSVTDNQA